MNQIQKDVLTLACTAYNDGDEATIFLDSSCGTNDIILKKYSCDKLIRAYDYLKDNGFVKQNVSCLGFFTFCPTEKGVDFYENNFQKFANISVTQGDNIILVNGSNNTISDNYSSIYNNIQKSDMCPEHKELVCQLLKELQSKPNTNTLDRLKTFVKNITDKGLSSAIDYSIPVLLSQLISHLK